MATLNKRVKSSGTYYYLVESARVNGKPRIVSQKYLGTAERIGEAVEYMNKGIPEPELTTVFEFGAVTALYDLAERIGIRGIIDKYSGKRSQGLPVGDSMLIAAINRVVAPTSKSDLHEWYNKTVLYKMFPKANASNLSCQGFWNNMDVLDTQKIRLIEDEVAGIVVEKYKLNTDMLLFDNTNFFTYIDTANKAKIPQRGHSKEKRSDLKIVGLSMMVSPDHSIPLFHESYEGNTNDAKRFSQVINQLKNRCKKFGGGECDATFVFDKGNNNEGNIDDLLSEEPCAVHFVGGLRLNQCSDLLSIPKQTFIPLEGQCFKSASAIRTKKEVYGKIFTVVLTNNPELYKAQLRGIENNIARCERELSELSGKLRRRREGLVTKGKKPTLESVKKNTKGILSAEHMGEIFDIAITVEQGSTPELSFTLNTDRFKDLQERVLGKSVLFTDRHEWSNEQIVGTYRAQYHVEEAFKRMKDTTYLTFRPIHHWTDSKIRVHAFYCVLALMLASLLNKEVEGIGYKMSMHRMLDKFSDAQQVISVFPTISGKKTAKSSFSRLDGIVKEYTQKFGLEKYVDTFN
jgi:transposase